MDVPIDPELLDNDVVDVSDGSSEEEWSGSDANFVRDDEDDDDDEDDSDGAEDETDAEDEYRGVKLEKGKGRAVDQDDNSDFKCVCCLILCVATRTEANNSRLLSAYNVGGVQTQDSRAAFESALGTQMREDLEDLEDDLGLLDVSGPRRKRRRAFKARSEASFFSNILTGTIYRGGLQLVCSSLRTKSETCSARQTRGTLQETSKRRKSTSTKSFASNQLSTNHGTSMP